MQTEKYFYFSDPSDAELSYILSMDRLYIAAATVKRMLLIRCMKRCTTGRKSASSSTITEVMSLCRPLLFFSDLIAVRLFFAVVSVATQQLWHQYVGAQTPISKSRLVFLKKIQTAEKLVDRGASRGVGYPELLLFYEFFQSFIKHRSMYYVSSNLVVPLTEKNKVSFSELVGPKLLTWFVSHFWGMAVPHFMESIQHHAPLLLAPRFRHVGEC